MMEFFDTHCHLNHQQFDAEVVDIQARARAAGVTRFLCIGWDIASSRKAVERAQSNDVRAAIGVHPESGAEWTDETRDALNALFVSHPDRIAAYGEIGLDYHWNTLPAERQQAVFAEQVAFARSLSPDLPIIIHCRDAQADTLAVLDRLKPPNPVVWHCFTGDRDAAEAISARGYFLGIGGVATYKKSDSVREAIGVIPLERILLETDCPYLAPQPWRGKRNEPAYLPAVAQTVAEVKGVSVEEVARVTTEKALRLFPHFLSWQEDRR